MQPLKAKDDAYDAICLVITISKSHIMIVIYYQYIVQPFFRWFFKTNLWIHIPFVLINPFIFYTLDVYDKTFSHSNSKLQLLSFCSLFLLHLRWLTNFSKLCTIWTWALRVAGLSSWPLPLCLPQLTQAMQTWSNQDSSPYNPTLTSWTPSIHYKVAVGAGTTHICSSIAHTH